MPAWLAEHADADGDPSIGLTRHAWCYEVPVLAIEQWRQP